MESILHSYILNGEGEKELVILHGFLGMSDNWKTLGSRFAQQGYRVHLVDQRNHGKSFHHEEFNYQVMSQDLLKYLDYHNIDSCNLMGHSMGGKTAMTFATKHSQRISKLIIVDISPKYYPPHHQDILLGLKKLYDNDITSREQAEYLLSETIKEKSVRQFLLKNLTRTTENTFKLKINFPALIKNIDFIGEALKPNAKCEKETLIVIGEASNYINNNDKKQFKLYFPNSIFATIPNASHWVHASEPNSFFESVFNFLKKTNKKINIL